MRRLRYPPYYRRSLTGAVLRAGWRPLLVLVLGFGPFVLCFASQSSATDAPSWSAAPSQPADYTFNDLELGLRARKVLTEDPILAEHKLGVTIHNRVAVLWGNVPTKEAAERAENQIRRLLGLTSIQNQLHIKTAAEIEPNPANLAPLQQRVPLAEAVVPQPARREQALTRRPDDRGLAPGQETYWQPSSQRQDSPSGRSQTVESPIWRPKGQSGDDTAQRPSQPSEAGPGIPTLAVPHASMTAAPRSAPPAARPRETLEQAVENLRLKDPRFQRVRPEVKGGVVYLRGLVSRWDHMYELARSVSVLPGVARVILEDVHTTGSP